MTRFLQRLVVGVVCLLSVSGAGLATADEREDGKQAKKQLAAGLTSTPGKPTLQTSYGLDKDDRKAAQGNRGRPLMGDPFGQLEDKSQIEGKEHGRPFRPPVAEPIPEPTPEPIPEPTPEPTPEPAPTEPITEPTEPITEEPVAEEPVTSPTEPNAEEPVATEPISEPAPEEPVASEPVTTEPIVEEPVATEPAPTPTEPIATEPVSEPTPEVSLPAPTNESVSWGYAGLLYGPIQELDKSVSWTYSTDSRIVGYNLYEQYPGEIGYHLLTSIQLSWADGTQGFWYRYYSGYQGIFSWVYIDKTYNRMGVLQRRAVSSVNSPWPEGTYHHYIVPIDAQGLEGTSSPILTCTNLGTIPMVQPKPGELVPPLAVFQWTDVTAGIRTTDATWAGYHWIKVWEWPNSSNGWQHILLTEKFLQLTTTSVAYDGPPLISGRTYGFTVVASLFSWAAVPEYGPSTAQQQFFFTVK